MNFNSMFGALAPQTDDYDTLLGEYYNPKAARWNAVGSALQGLGTGLMTNDWARAAEVSNSGMDDYRKQAVQKFQLSQLMETAQENRRKREEEAAAKQQREDWISSLPQEQQGLARLFPDEFGKSMVDQQFAQPEWRPATPEERASLGVDDNMPLVITADGPKVLGGGNTNVNIAGDMKLTEGQSKDLNYYSRGLGADTELSTLENNLLDAASAAGGAVPIVGNYLKDPKYRIAERSAREFLAIVLRKDTGAAVTQQEFDLYAPMYLPMPGDRPEDVKAKNIARKRVLQAIRRGAGTARPLYDEIDAEITAMSGAGQSGGGDVPEGWDPEDWKFLTPEEQERYRAQ